MWILGFPSGSPNIIHFLTILELPSTKYSSHEKRIHLYTFLEKWQRNNTVNSFNINYICKSHRFWWTVMAIECIHDQLYYSLYLYFVFDFGIKFNVPFNTSQVISGRWLIVTKDITEIHTTYPVVWYPARSHYSGRRTTSFFPLNYPFFVEHFTRQFQLHMLLKLNLLINPFNHTMLRYILTLI